MAQRAKTIFGGAAAALIAVVVLSKAAAAQNPPAAAPAGAPLTAQQLDDLVAPIALYPDPLLSQTLAASTYPVEIAEAEQWVKDHPNWRNSKLMKEAQKQNWDPSVQGLVAFPQALTLLSQNINWTTQLGNAFLAQQMDVMQAVQRMRAQAQAKGMLPSTSQQVVSTETQDSGTAITIVPANPEVWYVPYYNPVYIWGPPVWGYYPPLIYPGVDVGLAWCPGIDLGLYFGGWGGWAWGGWGWAPNWFVGNIYIDHSFFHRYGFRGVEGGPLGSSVWVHNPEHRLGVPYANREGAGRFAHGPAFSGRPQGFRPGEVAPQQRFGNPGFEQRGWTGDHSVFGGYHNGGMARTQSDRGFSSMGGRTFGGFGGGARAGGFGGAPRGGGRR